MYRNRTENAVSWRDTLFRLTCEDAPFDDKADRLYRTAKAQQEQYDDLLFPFPEGEDEDADETVEDTASWSQAFWRESTLTSLLEMLLGFEINKDDWRTLLDQAQRRACRRLSPAEMRFCRRIRANAMNTIT